MKQQEEEIGKKMSMFLDTAKIKVKAGKGGDGMVAFRREKYVPNGGPWGGDGGRGGNVVFVVDEGLRTLMDFRYNRQFKADSGEKGMTKGMHGRGAEDLFVRVPQGTTVRDAETGKVITDLVEHGQEFIVAHGGRGVVAIFALRHRKILLLKFLKMENQVKNANSN